MRLSSIAKVLEADWLSDGVGPLDLEIATCFAADLMSEVLAFCAPGALLVTGLANIQAVHTANLAELAGIIFINEKRPPQAVLDAAREQDVPLLTTALTMFDACGRLYEHGIQPARKG